MVTKPVTRNTWREIIRNRRNAALVRLVTDDTWLQMVSRPMCACACAREAKRATLRSYRASCNHVQSVTSKHWRGFRGFRSVTQSVTHVTRKEGEVVMAGEKPMRQAMPTVAAWIDDLRSAFGAESIDASIRAAVRDGRPTFYATEAGHELGQPATLGDPARSVSVGLEPLAKGGRAC